MMNKVIMLLPPFFGEFNRPIISIQMVWSLLTSIGDIVGRNLY